MKKLSFLSVSIISLSIWTAAVHFVDYTPPTHKKNVVEKVVLKDGDFYVWTKEQQLLRDDSVPDHQFVDYGNSLASLDVNDFKESLSEYSFSGRVVELLSDSDKQSMLKVELFKEGLQQVDLTLYCANKAITKALNESSIEHYEQLLNATISGTLVANKLKVDGNLRHINGALHRAFFVDGRCKEINLSQRKI